MKKGLTLIELIMCIVTVIAILSIPLFYYIPAKMEADAFNRFSDVKITWWDALWADYRIIPVRNK